jgi:hypothetical protein
MPGESAATAAAVPATAKPTAVSATATAVSATATAVPATPTVSPCDTRGQGGEQHDEHCAGPTLLFTHTTPREHTHIAATAVDRMLRFP